MARLCRMVIGMLALAVMNGGCIHAGLTATTISSSSEVNGCGEFYSGAAFAAIGPSPAGEWKTFGEGCREVSVASAYQQYVTTGVEAAYEIAGYVPTEESAAHHSAEQEEAIAAYCRDHRDDSDCVAASTPQTREGGAP